MPSTGVLFSTDLFGSERKYTVETMPRLPITIEFATAADAQRAVTAMRAPRPSLSRDLAAQIAKLTPVAHGRDLELDIAPLFARPELLDEMQAAIERIRKQ
jgi:hypothetical protein